MLRFYDAFYSRGTASAVVVASWVALAASQVRVVFEAMQHLHRAWPVWWQWIAAAGFELATLAVGLVIAVAGSSRRLWAALALFVTISSWMGFDGAMRSQLGDVAVISAVRAADPLVWVRALFGGTFLPFMYLAAIMAGHQLAHASRSASSVRTQRAASARLSLPALEPKPTPLVLDPVALALSEPTLTNAEIARRCTVHPATVGRHLQRAGIVRGSDGALRSTLNPAAVATKENARA